MLLTCCAIVAVEFVIVFVIALFVVLLLLHLSAWSATDDGDDIIVVVAVSVGVDVTADNYALRVDEQVWLRSAPSALLVEGKLQTSLDGLQLVEQVSIS